MKLFYIFSFGLLSGIALGSPVHSFKDKCEAFADDVKDVAGHHVHVNIAEYVAKGTALDLKADGVNETCLELQFTGPPVVGADSCRLALEVETSHSSSIIMELWMPKEWEGRFLTTGTGGVSGCKFLPDIGISSTAD
jgi:feruloyl esterase